MSQLRTYALAAGYACWAFLGIALPALLVTQASIPSMNTVLLVAGCTIMITVLSHVQFEFGDRDSRFSVSLDSTFMVLTAVLLEPSLAALTAGLGYLYATRTPPRRAALLRALNASAATGIASLAVAHSFGQSPDVNVVLPAALVAASVRTITAFAGTLLLEEAQSAGAGYRVWRTTPIQLLLLLETMLPVAAIALAGPYLGSPALAGLIVTMYCGVIWLVLQTLHRQSHQQRDNDYLRDTVSRYMPLNLAEQLIEQNELLELGGTQHEITVLFCDIRGFTSWAERHQPDDVITELNRLLSDLSQAVLDTDGTIDKFTGDGLMAFWGAPDAQADHAVRAMQSVPRMLMRVREFNLAREARGEEALNVGIGIHSGLAMVGNVGHKDRLNYTAVGDTVNLAARMEQSTKQFDCPLLVSESTFLQLPTSMQRQLVRLDSISVKGRRDRVRLYTLLSLVQYRMDMSTKNSA